MFNMIEKKTRYEDFINLMEHHGEVFNEVTTAVGNELKLEICTESVICKILRRILKDVKRGSYTFKDLHIIRKVIRMEIRQRCKEVSHKVSESIEGRTSTNSDGDEYVLAVVDESADVESGIIERNTDAEFVDTVVKIATKNLREETIVRGWSQGLKNREIAADLVQVSGQSFKVQNVFVSRFKSICRKRCEKYGLGV